MRRKNPDDSVMPETEDPDYSLWTDPAPCPDCGCQMIWEECPDCDGSGFIEDWDEGLYIATDACEKCYGQGGWLQCPACSGEEQ